MTLLGGDKKSDLFIFVQHLIERGHIMYCFFVVFFLLGLLSAFSRPAMYVAKVVIVPQTRMDFLKTPKFQVLSSIANLSMSDDVFIRPLMYKQIVSSVPFQLEMMNTQINVKDSSNSGSLADYYTHYK